MLPPEVFLDSAYAIALVADTDQYHAQAVTLARQLRVARTKLITTQAILLEIGNSLAKRRYRTAAVQILTALQSDPSVEIVAVGNDLYAAAFQIFQQRPDKDWSLTDCVSFAVMQDRGLTAALTSDAHFRQAGFVALLGTHSG